MKLSTYIKNELDYIDDELILEAADTRRNKSYDMPAYIVGTTADTVKNALSTAACIVLAVVVVIAFILMRNSITTPSDTDTDTGTGTNTETVTESETETETETETEVETETDIETEVEELESAPARDFEYVIENGEVTITKYNGSLKKVIIPDTIEGYPVKHLGTWSEAWGEGHLEQLGIFFRTEVHTVTIPGTVEVINAEALHSTDITSIILQEGVVEIEPYAFKECGQLIRLTVPKSLKKIGENAFYETWEAGIGNLKAVYYYGNSGDWENLMKAADQNAVLENAVVYYHDDSNNDFSYTDVSFIYDDYDKLHYAVEEYANNLLNNTEYSMDVSSSDISRSIPLTDPSDTSDDDELDYLAEYYIFTVRKSLDYSSSREIFVCTIRDTKSFTSSAKIVKIEECIDEAVYSEEYILGYINDDPRYSNLVKATLDQSGLYSDGIEAYNMSKYEGIRELLEIYGDPSTVKHSVIPLPPAKDIDSATWLMKILDETSDRYQFYTFSLNMENGKTSNLQKWESYDDIRDTYYGLPESTTSESEDTPLYESDKLIVYHDEKRDLYVKYKKSGKAVLLHDAFTDEDVQKYMEENGLSGGDDYPIDMHSGTKTVKVVDDRFIIFNILGWESVIGLIVYEVDTEKSISLKSEKIYTVRGNRLYLNMGTELAYVDLIEGGNYEFSYVDELSPYLCTEAAEEGYRNYIISENGQFITLMTVWDNSNDLKHIVIINTATGKLYEYYIYNPFATPLTFSYTDDGNIMISSASSINIDYDPVEKLTGYGSSIGINSYDQYVYLLKLPS